MRTAVVLLLLATLPGSSALEGHACTAMGSVNGSVNCVVIEFVPDLQLVTGSMAVIVCDDEYCGSFDDSWGRRHRSPGPSGLVVTFHDLGHTFDPGVVTVTVELSDEVGTLVAQREEEVELSRDFPNGRAATATAGSTAASS